jgi:hypothetical protein
MVELDYSLIEGREAVLSAKINLATKCRFGQHTLLDLSKVKYFLAKSYIPDR